MTARGVCGILLWMNHQTEVRMELEQAKQRAEELRRVIERNNRLYYMEDAPEPEDFEYDALTRELKAIEAEYPQLVTPSSPTQPNRPT